MRQGGARYVKLLCLYWLSLVGKHSRSSNCQDDKTDMFFSLKNLLDQDTSHTPELEQMQFVLPILRTHRFKYIENQVLYYILDFVLKKIKPLVKECSNCTERLFTASPNLSESFALKKEYVAKRGLTYVSNNLKTEWSLIYQEIFIM